MLNLDVIQNQTIDFTLNNKEIHMKIPSQATLRSIEVVAAMKDKKKQEEQLYSLYSTMMSNNLESEVFTVDYLKTLNPKTLIAWIEYVMEEIQTTKKK